KLTRNRFGITLSGTYPSASDRDGLLGALRKIEGIPAITDRIEVSELCGPTEWLDPLKSILPALLSGLRGEMTAEFTGSQIRLSGVAPDEATKHDLLNRFTRFQVGSPLYEFVGDIGLEGGGAAAELELTAIYEGGLLTLSGQVPSADFAVAVGKRLAQPLPDVSVKNGVTVVEGSAQDRWVSRLADFFAEALPRVSSAKFVFKGRELELEGRTLALSDRQLVQNLAVNTVPSSYRVHNRLLHADQPFPKPALQPEERTRLAEALKSHPVYFGKNSDEIGADERKKVAAVAEALKAAGTEAELVVTGVSDNIGNAQSNRELSLRRAEGVRAELVRLGIAEGTLSVESKSEDVSGISQSERWKSRRVEISLKPAGNAPAEP
ncbi:MAG TPA: OmpA family protein, partial [Bacteroidia bacterium]|nr:OmpA family protein [Bacteroidia bacterium]